MAITKDQIISVIENAGTQIDMSKLDNSTEFTEIGADSLDMMNILLGLQELGGAEIPDEEVDNLNTVDKILQHFNG